MCTTVVHIVTSVNTNLENSSNIFKILWDYKKLLDKILKILETQSSYAYMLQTGNCY